MSDSIDVIGEFGLIDRIRALLRKEGLRNEGVVLESGDDAASVLPREGCELLITCDVLVENRHYLPQYTNAFDLGRRAMSVNISDIGAMGGLPLYALVSLGLKARTAVMEVEHLYRGFLAELNPLDASIIGGNLTKVDHADFIDITLIGEVKRGQGVRRCTATAGDAILVTGYPGQAAAGLQLLRRPEKKQALYSHPLVRAYITPGHRAREGHAAAQTGAARAMIDTSDGFLADLEHICKESGVGALLIREALPLSGELRSASELMKRDPYEFFLGESDDYELIITCPPEKKQQIIAAIAGVSDIPVTEIGEITQPEKGIQIKLPDGRLHPVTKKGWDHFKT